MKFLDWKFIHEPFNSLEPSNEFEERYAPKLSDHKQKRLRNGELNPSLIRFHSGKEKFRQLLVL